MVFIRLNDQDMRCLVAHILLGSCCWKKRALRCEEGVECVKWGLQGLVISWGVCRTLEALCAAFVWMWTCRIWVLDCESKVELALARMQPVGSHLDQKAWFYSSFHWFGYFKSNPKIALEEGVFICRIWLAVRYYRSWASVLLFSWNNLCVWPKAALKIKFGLDGVVLMVNIWNFCSVSIYTSALSWYSLKNFVSQL